jgi:endonuclease/exonuclease/phosphatase family metal-dependent hydrolase
MSIREEFTFTYEDDSSPVKKNTQLKTPINVMTFNVELFLNMYRFTMTGNSVQNATILPERVAAFCELFEGVDVACLQETYISTDSDSDTQPQRCSRYPWNATLGACNGLRRVHSGKSHILNWANATYLYGTPSYLANSVYVSDRFSVIPGAPDDAMNEHSDASCKINNAGLDRGYSLASVLVDGTPVKIVSVHLIGGRYDDIEALQNESFRNEKTAQISHIIQLQPDIICGDFNTKIKTEHIAESTDAYFEHIYSCSDISPDVPKAEYKAIWDKWIYMDSIHALLSESGYRSVYSVIHSMLLPSHSADSTNTSASSALQCSCARTSEHVGECIRTDITDTCMFGGIVDMIYYKPSRVQLVENSVQSMDASVMEKQPPTSAKMFRPILSDHFPVKASFVIA